jgi:hypothetical protein
VPVFERDASMRIHPMIGFRVKAHHPRGGHYTGVVIKAQHEEGRGMVLTLNTGASIIPRDVVEKIDPPKSFYVSTYCNFAHSMASGKPIKHECRCIPPAALRLEREGLFTEAIAIIEGRKPCKDCTEYAPIGANYCDRHEPHDYGISPGDRVELKPHLDAWIRGARFGDVVSIDAKKGNVRVKLDKLAKPITTAADNVTVLPVEVLPVWPSAPSTRTHD